MCFNEVLKDCKDKDLDGLIKEKMVLNYGIVMAQNPLGIKPI